MKRFLFSALMLVGLILNTHTQTITTGSLFEEMINLELLSSIPDPWYEMVQYSSYDHRSTIPGGPDWWANSDGFGGEPEPNFEEVISYDPETKTGEFVVADVKGPGAIVRLWTARLTGWLKCISMIWKNRYSTDRHKYFSKPRSTTTSKLKMSMLNCTIKPLTRETPVMLL